MIRPAGFGAEGFEEGKIPGAQNLREQVLEHLTESGVEEQAAGKVKEAAQKALGIDNPADKKTFITGSQSDVDRLFDESEARQKLPEGTIGNTVYATLKKEFSERHNVERAASQLAEEAEIAKLPKPEAVFRSTRAAVPAEPAPAAPPPAAPSGGLGAEGAGGGGLGGLFDALPDDIRKTIEELFRKMSGGGERATVAGPPLHQRMFDDYQLQCVSEFQKARDANDQLSAEYAYEKFKNTMGMTSKAPGAGKKEEEEEKAKEGPSASAYLKMAQEEKPASKAAKPSLFGAEAPPRVEAPPSPPTLQTQSPQAGAFVFDLVTPLKDCILKYLHWDPNWGITKELFKLYDGAFPGGKPINNDIKAAVQQIRNKANIMMGEVSNNGNIDEIHKILFRAFSFSDNGYISPVEQRALDDLQRAGKVNSKEIDNVIKFGNFIFNLASWGAPSGKTDPASRFSDEARSYFVRDILNFKMFDARVPNIFYQIQWCLNFEQKPSPLGQRRFEQFQSEFYRLFFVENPNMKGGDGRINPYFIYPGFSPTDIQNFWTKVIRLDQGEVVRPIPKEETIDKFYREAWVWTNSLLPQHPDWDLAGDIQGEISRLLKSNIKPQECLTQLYNWGKSLWVNNDKHLMKPNITPDAIKTLMRITGYDPLGDLRTKINSWGTTEAELKLRDAILGILDGLLKPTERNLKTLQETLYREIFSKRIFFLFPGLEPRADLDNLCNGILGINKKLIADDLDKKMIDIVKWQASATTEQEKKLAKWLFDQMYTSYDEKDYKKIQPKFSNIDEFNKTLPGKWATDIKPNFWKDYGDLTGAQAKIFGDLIGVSVGFTRVEVEDKIYAWLHNNALLRDFAYDLIEQIRKGPIGNFENFPDFLKTQYFNKHVYCLFPGLKQDDLKLLCTSLGIYKEKEFPPDSTAAEKILADAYIYSLGKSPGCVNLFEWVCKFMIQYPDADPSVTLKREWKHEFDFWTVKEFQGVTEKDIIEFKRITGLNIAPPFDKIREDIAKWGQTDPERRLREAILKVFDNLPADKRTIQGFQAALREQIFSKGDVYFMFYGLRDGDSFKNLFSNILDLGTIPTANDNDRKMMAIWEWKTSGTNSISEQKLADWLFSQMFKSFDPKEENFTKNIPKFAADLSDFKTWVIQQWTTMPDVLKNAEGFARVAFINITGYQPLADVLAKVKALPDSALKTAILTAINNAMNQGSSLAELQASLKTEFFTDDIYFKYPGLTQALADGLAGAIGNITAKRSDALDDAFRRLCDWKVKLEQDPKYKENADWKLANYLYNNMRKPDGTRVYTNMETFQNWVRSVWQKIPLPAEIREASNNARIDFMNITKIDPIVEALDSIGRWGNPGGEANFRNALLTYIREKAVHGNTPENLRTLVTDFIKERGPFYAEFLGLTPDRLKDLFNNPYLHIDAAKARAMQPQETLIFNAWNYWNTSTITQSGRNLFQQYWTFAQQQLLKNPGWTIDQLKESMANWWKITSQNFWDNPDFKGLDNREIGSFEKITDLKIPVRPDPVDPAERAIKDYLTKLEALNNLWKELANDPRIELALYRGKNLWDLTSEQWLKINNIVSRSRLDKAAVFKNLFNGSFVPSIGTSISGPQAFKTLRTLYQNMLAEIDKHKPNWTKTDLLNWATDEIKRTDLYPALTDDQRKFLLELIKKAQAI